MHRGGGNSRLTSHNQGFSLIEAFNNLALWGEKKFVSELKRTYKFQRGVNCHTEDNSPKYHMVGNDVGLESQTHRSFKFWYRDFCSSLRANAKQSSLLNRLRNKCAMTCAGNMNPNTFSNKVYSLFTSHFSLKSAAFTLAEVLVTLGIIGVVSAMTVPTLMQNYQRQSYVTQLHKTYNEVSQALLRYQTDRNALNLTEAGLSSQTAWDAMVAQYFKTVQKCDNSLTPCFPATTSYKKMSGVALNSNVYDIKTSYVLASGASVRFYYAVNGNRICFLMVDVNGKKGPNILGRDLFTLSIYNDGTIDDDGSSAPLSEADRNTLFERDCNGDTGAGDYGCFGKILNDNWQMNY